MRRAGDAGDFATAAEVAGPLFAQIGGDGDAGPFAASKVTPDTIERVVGEVIWRHRGRGNPIRIATLAKMFGKSERTIKGVVHELVVTHRMRIGGSRDGDVGYFVIEDAQDLAAAVGPYQSQIFAMWRRLGVLLSKHELRALHGQLTLGDGTDGTDVGRTGSESGVVPGDAAARGRCEEGGK